MIKGVQRIQGIMIKKGNPLGVTGIEDLPRLRYINRQRGAGTRVLLDYKLKQIGISPQTIHGYEKEVRKVYIKCMIEENIFTVEVCDQGKGIENIEEAMCPMYTTRPDQDRSGMGFAFMEAFMDSVEVESELGKGTRVRMKKAVGKGRDIWTTQSL